MVGNYLKTVWTNTAKAQLRSIFDFLKYVKSSPQGAKQVKKEILDAAGTVSFEGQYQKDDIQPEYRRIIVRQF